jgi:glycosyltransferase involved in cell wall biosynthesis
MFCVVIPTKNESANIGRCLDALKGVEDIVLIDSGSTDGTCEIARARGVTVVDFKWDGGFPKKRNWTLRNVPLKKPWVLFLDADEVVSEAFLDEVRRTLPTTTHDGFWLSYTNYFLGRRLEHGDPFRKLALFRVGSGEYERIDEKQWSHLDMEVHEHPVLGGTVGEITSPIEHNDFKGLFAYVQRHNEYSTWEARRYLSLMQSGAEKWTELNPRQQRKYKNLRKGWFPFGYFFASYVLKRGALDGGVGLAFWLHKAFYFYQVQLKISELERQRG